MKFDEALIQAYVEIDTPADQLTIHDDLAARFVDAVQRFTQEPIDRAKALHRLISLRKMGRLPRLRRGRS